jgi:hypothetical protein
MSARDEWVEWLRLAINSFEEADENLAGARGHANSTYNAMPGNAAGEPEAYALREEIDRIRELLGAATLKAHRIIVLIGEDSESHDDEEEDEDDDLS